MTTEESSVLNEVRQRTRRIETRLMRLCEFSGLDATAGATRGAVVHKGGAVHLELQGYDVSLSDCLRICQQEGIVGGITLMVRGEEVGALLVAPRRGA